MEGGWCVYVCMWVCTSKGESSGPQEEKKEKKTCHHLDDRPREEYVFFLVFCCHYSFSLLLTPIVLFFFSLTSFFRSTFRSYPLALNTRAKSTTTTLSRQRKTSNTCTQTLFRHFAPSFGLLGPISPPSLDLTSVCSTRLSKPINPPIKYL
jgi:hypothetical protein